MNTRRNFFRNIALSLLAAPVVIKEFCKPLVSSTPPLAIANVWTESDITMYNRLPFYSAEMRIATIKEHNQKRIAALHTRKWPANMGAIK